MSAHMKSLLTNRSELLYLEAEKLMFIQGWLTRVSSEG